MEEEFQRGLLTGLSLKPLRVTTSDLSSDMVDWKFSDHNLLADESLFTNPSSMSIRVDGETVTLTVPSNMKVEWYPFTKSLDFLKKNHLYKIEAPNFGYGRLALTTKDVFWDPCGFRAACSWPASDTVIINSFKNHPNWGTYLTSKSTYFIPIEVPLEMRFCSDLSDNGVRAAYSTRIAIYEQL